MSWRLFKCLIIKLWTKEENLSRKLNFSNLETNRMRREGHFTGVTKVLNSVAGKRMEQDRNKRKRLFAMKKEWCTTVRERKDFQVAGREPRPLGERGRWWISVQFSYSMSFNFCSLLALFSQLACRFAKRYLLLLPHNYWILYMPDSCPRLWLITGIISCLMFSLWENKWVHI